jgi:hypothetical protein
MQPKCAVHAAAKRGDKVMLKFITIGYGAAADYERTPRPVRDAAHAQDAKLVAAGAVMGIAGAPVQVRNPEALGVETRDGPFMSSALPIAGFALIEANDLADAIEKVSRVPCAVAHGVVEVWPLKESA